MKQVAAKVAAQSEQNSPSFGTSKLKRAENNFLRKKLSMFFIHFFFNFHDYELR